jgi:hypothetical protein
VNIRPRSSIDEIEAATHEFCKIPWDYAKENFLGKKHKYTSDSQLHYRCLESLYIVTLLEHGFGFDGGDQKITLAVEVISSVIYLLYIEYI